MQMVNQLSAVEILEEARWFARNYDPDTDSLKETLAAFVLHIREKEKVAPSRMSSINYPAAKEDAQ